MKITYNLLYFFIKLWQETRFVRSFFGFSCCRFYPSCSDYFLEAVKKLGLISGFYAFLKRLIRCHPFSTGGIDGIMQKHGP